jgi:hypothetical protein
MVCQPIEPKSPSLDHQPVRCTTMSPTMAQPLRRETGAADVLKPRSMSVPRVISQDGEQIVEKAVF